MDDNNNQSEDTLLTFPCTFPIKIIGNNTGTFFDEIVAIIHRFFPDTHNEHIRQIPSKQGSFASITALLHVNDKETLDNLYRELTQHPDTKMVL